MGMGQGRGRVFADSGGYSFPAAALVNGTLIHSLDFDDTHIAATVHPTAPVFAAALAAGQMANASGADVMAGVVAGYEVMSIGARSQAGRSLRSRVSSGRRLPVLLVLLLPQHEPSVSMPISWPWLWGFV